MKHKSLKYLKELAWLAFGVFAMAVTVTNNSVAAGGVRDGLNVCADTLIPSIFPFMMLAKFLILTDSLSFCQKLFARPFAFLFRLPPAAAPAVIISFLGGFPVGAALADELKKSGKIDGNQFRIMLSFCVCAGPAFIIEAVGVRLFGSIAAGLIIYASVILSGVVTGAVYCRLIHAKKPDITANVKRSRPAVSYCLVKATDDASYAMITVCAFVLLFSALDDIIFYCTGGNIIGRAATFVLEVTNGASLAAEYGGLPVSAAICSFSGVAVICQILSLIKNDVSTPKFFLCRIFSAAVTFAICTLLLKIFPSALPVFKNFDGAKSAVSRNSLILACSLMFMSVIFLLSLGKEPADRVDFTCDV